MIIPVRFASNIFAIFLLVSFAGPVSATGLKNQLSDHASPYLAMHGTDPVHWQEWGKAAIARARRENKLLFVSSGYFSCHWCHVMQRESYKNKKIAAVINKYFIPVKVDRELSAALDARLIDFVERTRGSAGWPLNVFVTPEGYPLVGMTYVPADNFLELLNKLAKQWADHRAELKKVAIQATQALTPPKIASNAKLEKGLGKKYIRLLMDQAYQYTDELAGGFGSQNKFPSVPQLSIFLDIYQQKPEERIGEFLRLTLDQMASQGLRDHLGGGFFRYTVDPNWQVPHFEKMLYDNAQLAELYLRAAQIFKHPQYESIGRETLDFMLREFATTQGGFAASLSAVDEQGDEGGGYVWQTNKLKKLLTAEEFRIAALVWQLEGAPDLETGHHLVQIMDAMEAGKIEKISAHKAARLLQSARDKMISARKQRMVPKDNKIIAAWNGLALSAFVRGARLDKGMRYRQAAKQLRDYFAKVLWKGNKLFRAHGPKAPIADGGLEDYAYVAAGLYDWAQLTQQQTDFQFAEQVAKEAWRRFYGKQGWQLAENMLLKYGAGQTLLADGAMQAPSAVLAQTSLQLAAQLKNKSLRKYALRSLNVGQQTLQAEPFWYASHIAAIANYQWTDVQ